MEFNQDLPLFLQVRQEIERAIITGSLKADDIVPSIRKIAQQYRLNPQTVSNALSQLLEEGYLYKKRGVGLFVSHEAPRKLRQRKAREFREKELKQLLIRAKGLGLEREELLEAVNDVFGLPAETQASATVPPPVSDEVIDLDVIIGGAF